MSSRVHGNVVRACAIEEDLLDYLKPPRGPKLQLNPTKKRENFDHLRGAERFENLLEIMVILQVLIVQLNFR